MSDQNRLAIEAEHPTGWPALSSSGPWPEVLKVEEGIWGKVHGAPTDFRWIAASPGLDLPDLGPALQVGVEDRPTRCAFWRVLDDGRALAVYAYPSRAVDAAGRSGFLERRVFLWRPEPEVSALQAAAALLSRVAQPWTVPEALDFSSPVWHRPEHVWPLETRFLRSSREDSDRRLAQGLSRLREAVTEASLKGFYLRWLTDDRPAVLEAPEPLPPEALPALLLPLPADRAATLSVAGWIPSSRVAPVALAERWPVVVADRLLAEARTPEPEQLEIAERMAAAVFEGNPALLGHPSEPTRPPVRPIPASVDADTKSWLMRVQDFVENPEARWLDPQTFPEPPALNPVEASLLAEWRDRVQATLPPEADAWQWAAKLDVLASLIVAGAPEAPEARAMPFLSHRVPPLLWVARFSAEKRAAWRRRCPDDLERSWSKTSTEIDNRGLPDPRVQRAAF